MAVYPSSATPRRSAGSAHVTAKATRPARPRQSPPTPTSPTRPPHTSAVLRVLHQIRQRLPNDHLVIRIVFPAPGMPADRRRPTRPTMLGRLRVPIRRAAPTAGRRDTTMRCSRTHVLDRCLNQVRLEHQLAQRDCAARRAVKSRPGRVTWVCSTPWLFRHCGTESTWQAGIRRRLITSSSKLKRNAVRAEACRRCPPRAANR